MQKYSSDIRVYVGIIVILVIVSAALFMQLQNQQPKEVNGVKEIYRTITDRDAEILSVKDQSGLYKATVKTVDAQGRAAVQDVYVTKDGAMFTSSLVNVKDFIDRLNKEKNFSACLASKNLVLLGQGNDIVAFQQLLGSFVGRIYLDCTASQQNLQQCQLLGQQAGSQSIPAPSVLYNNTVYLGFRDVSFVSSLTGCTA